MGHWRMGGGEKAVGLSPAKVGTLGLVTLLNTLPLPTGQSPEVRTTCSMRLR